MPGYKGHLAGGLITYACGLFLLSSFNPSFATMSEWLLCVLAGSLFPDVDIKSKGQKLLYRFLFILFFFLVITQRYQMLIFISILAVVPMIVRHRGLFHKLWFVTLLPFLFAFCITIYFPDYQSIILYDVLFFIAGAISHLWLDMGFARMLRV